MRLEFLARVFQASQLAVVALMPSIAIWYLLTFSTQPMPIFEDHLFHEFAIAIATLIGGFITYVSWRSYQASGEIFLRWLTVAFLVFTLIYTPHGLFTRTAHHNIWLFLLYGPVSRLAMLGCLVYGLTQYGKPTEDPKLATQGGFWPIVYSACAVTVVAVAVLAFSPIASKPWVRMPMEISAILLCLIGVAVMVKRRINSPLMLYYGAALLFFAQAALAFILGKPWNHLWWLAHAIFATGFSVIGWGVMRALMTTRSFASAFSQEKLVRDLEASQLRLEAVLNGVQDCVITIDKFGIVQSFNRSAEKTFGYLAAEVINRNIKMLMPEPVQTEHDGYLSHYAETGERKVIGNVREVNGQRKDRSVFPIELWVTETRVNDAVVYIGSLRDVSAIKQANEQLQIAATAFEAQEGIIVTDANQKILRANQAFLNQSGFTEADLIGQSIKILRPGLHDADFYAAMWQMISDTGHWQGEISGRRIQGAIYPKWLSITAIRNDSGAVSHYVSTHIDITERKRINAELSAAKAVAETANAAKSNFLATMSHEIRTPMNGILGMLKLLGYTQMTPQQADYAHKAESSTKALLGIINDILDFSKVEAGKLELDTRDFSLNELLRDLSTLISASVKGKPVEILFAIDPEVPPILVGDTLRLRQVLINLLGNAIKFTDKGEVILSISLQKRIHDATGNSRVTLNFSVKDSGIGIAPDKIDYVFEGFNQAESSTSRRFGGTGLGLSISRRLIALMGGDLQVESTLGSGSRFYFSATFPVSRITLPAPPPLTADGRIRHALIVDDNASSRMVLTGLVRSFGWPCESVDSGAAALVRLADASAEPIHVVFMDWHMSGLDGWETTRKIRLQESAKTTLGVAPLVIMVSISGQEELAQKSAREIGILDGYLLKPVTGSMLYDSVLSAMARREDKVTQVQPLEATNRLAGMRLLVVEDNELNQQITQVLLTHSGAQVEIAGGGIAGVQMALETKPLFDAILMDMQMPDIDGIEATRRIRAQSFMANVPIIAMTANVMADEKAACFAAGMIDHVGKPIDLEVLITTLLRHVVLDSTNTKISTSLSNSAPAISALEPTAALTLNAEQPPMIDDKAAVARLGGSREFYSKLVFSFGDEAALQIAQARQHLTRTELTSAALFLHTLKGLAATVGAMPLAQRAGKIETALRLSNAPTQTVLQQQLDDLSLYLQQVVLALMQSPSVVTSELVQFAIADQAKKNNSQSLDKNALQQTLGEIELFLKANNLNAIALCAQCRLEYQTALNSEQVKQLLALDAAVNQLDFGLALTYCIGLMEALK